MKRHIALYESWSRRETIVLESKNGNQQIVLSIVEGSIHSIENRDQIKVPFFTGQPFQTPFVKGWACENEFMWNGTDPLKDRPGPAKKIEWGMNMKHSSNLRRWIEPKQYKK